MKTVADLHTWLAGVEEACGDPSAATAMIFARYQAVETPSGDITARYEGDRLLLKLADVARGGALPQGDYLRIPIDPGGYVMRDAELVAFGIEQVMPGLWHLNPSLNIPDVLHVFVVLYDVPTPAPWESRIIV